MGHRIELIHAAFAGLLALSAPAATAAPVFFTTQGSTLYRASLRGTIETFTLSDSIVGMTRTPTGAIWMTGATPDSAGHYTMYQLEDPTGPAPTLRPLSGGLTSILTSVTFAGTDLYAVTGGTELVTLDPGAGFAATPRGSMGLPTTAGGLAYRAANDSMYAATVSITPGDAAVWVVPYADSPPTASRLRTFDIVPVRAGLEFHRGLLYMAALRDTGALELGGVDLRTGAYSTIALLDAVPTPEFVSLAVIPAPGAGVLGLVAIASAGRRPRRAATPATDS